MTPPQKTVQGGLPAFGPGRQLARLPRGQHLVTRTQVVVEKFRQARCQLEAAAVCHRVLCPSHVRERHGEIGILRLILQDGVDAPGEHVLRVGMLGGIASLAVLPAHRRQPVVHQLRQRLEVDVRENPAASRPAVKQEVALQPVARGHVAHHDAYARERIAHGRFFPFPEQLFGQFL